MEFEVDLPIEEVKEKLKGVPNLLVKANGNGHSVIEFSVACLRGELEEKLGKPVIWRA